MRNCPNPQCGIPIVEEDARFCPVCRTRLEPAAGGTGAPSGGTTAVSSTIPAVGLEALRQSSGQASEPHDPDVFPEATSTSRSAAIPDDGVRFPPSMEAPHLVTPPPYPAPNAGRAIPAQNAQEGSARGNAAGKGCSDLLVLYNMGRIFVEGSTMPFGFRIKPLKDGLSDFVVVIRSGDVTVVDEPEWEPDVGEEVDTPIAFRPPQGLSGVNVFNIYVGYRKGEDYLWYTKRVTHEVFKAQEQVGKVLETLRIEINNNPSAREAGDAPVNNYIQGLDRILKGAQGSIEDFKAFNPPPVWVTLDLLKCTKPPLQRKSEGKPRNPPPPEAVVPGLTLRMGKRRIHVLGASAVTLGRNRECGIVVRLPYPGGVRPTDERKDQNLYISQKHLRITLDKGQAFARDESSCGTEMDGVPLAKSKDTVIPPDRSFTLRLAIRDVPSDLPHAAFECRAWSGGQASEGSACPGTGAPNEVAAVTLQRRDTPTETFVLLPHRLRLSALVPGCGDACLCRHSNGFVLKTGHGCHWLMPGTQEATPAGTLTIEPFKQELS